MNLIASMTWKRNFLSCFKAGQVLDFYGPICVMVGECGSGKSTILRALVNGGSQIVRIDYQLRLPIHYHDFENGSPRIKPISACANDDELIVCTRAVSMSHGQSNLILIEELDDAENKLILLDEPESGLSPKNCRELYRTMELATKRGCHFIIATHSPVLALMAESILDLGEMRRRSALGWLDEAGVNIPNLPTFD